MSIISPADIKTIITDPTAAQVLVQSADNLGGQLQELGLTTSQIRALFGEVRQIEAQWSMEGSDNRQKALRRLILLKPKMAYRARKETGKAGKAVQELVDVLQLALDEVVQEKNPRRQSDNFGRFVEFFEAILAYHRAHGGR